MTSLRPSGFDELGLRRALSDRMLPLLVAAMAFLAALALAGWFGTAALSRHWQQGASASLTVQVPRASEPSALMGQIRADQAHTEQAHTEHAHPEQAHPEQAHPEQAHPEQAHLEQAHPEHAHLEQAHPEQAPTGQTRLAAVLTLLTGTPGVASAHALSERELDDLLKPWLGQGTERLAIPIPAVIAVRLTNATVDLEPLSRRLDAAAPGTLVEDHSIWIRRLAVLVRSLQACAALALVLVAGVAAAVIAVATRAGLATRREAIEIVHGLGATDRYIAGRFAGRATLLAAIGAAAGAFAALPILLTLARLAAPFSEATGPAGDTLADAMSTLSPSLWAALPCLPVIAAAIGYGTAHWAVRRWLRGLP